MPWDKSIATHRRFSRDHVATVPGPPAEQRHDHVATLWSAVAIAWFPVAAAWSAAPTVGRKPHDRPPAADQLIRLPCADGHHARPLDRRLPTRPTTPVGPRAMRRKRPQDGFRLGREEASSLVDAALCSVIVDRHSRHRRARQKAIHSRAVTRSNRAANRRRAPDRSHRRRDDRSATGCPSTTTMDSTDLTSCHPLSD